MFSNDIQQHLLKSGWTPDRKIDSSPYVDFLSSIGFHVNNHAIEYLNQFGGLVIPYLGEHQSFSIDSSISLVEDRNLNPDYVKELSVICAEFTLDLCVVGAGYYYLLISSEGDFFLDFEGDLTLVGNGISDSIENILYSKNDISINY
jgi:hypothetical protein